MKTLIKEIPDLWMENCAVATASKDWLVAGRFALCYYSYEYNGGAIDRANFESYQEALEGRDFRVTNVEGLTYILIHPDDFESIEIVNGLLENLVNYPILDEDKIHFCDVCDTLSTSDDICECE